MKKLFRITFFILFIAVFISAAGCTVNVRVNIDGMKINRDLSSSATASPVQTTAPQPSETSALQTTQPSSNTEQPSEEPSQTPDQTLPQPQQPEGNTPETWNIQQIIDCYKAGMQKTDDTYDCSTDQKMQLVGKLPGKAAAISGPVNLAMKLGSQPFNALTGGYWDLVPDDLISADAHTDGKYTVINLYPKEQTDGPGADEHEGTTGHVVNVVQGIDDFLAYVEENFGILNASYTQEGVVIHYRDAYAKDVKINNETGEMESGTWGYIIDLSIDDASLLGISLDGFKTTIQYDCWYPVED